VESTLLLLILACGAAGLYLALPGGRRRLGGLALLLLAVSLGAGVGLIVPRLAGGAARGWFVTFSLVGAAGALRMITHRRPVYSALYFILVVVSVTGLLVLMEAEFLAAALVLIYAGAILVTYVFVIMLAQQSEPASYDVQAREPLLGCVAGFVLLALLTGRLFGEPAGSPGPQVQALGTPLDVGVSLLTRYVIALQLAGVLLLAALVGAIAIARRPLTGPSDGESD